MLSADVVLFEDHAVTTHAIPGAVFRPRRTDDAVFGHAVEPVGDYVVELSGKVIARGGFPLHYNRPFADLYMEVREDSGGSGMGSFLLQKIKKECYLAGRVPAARCDLRNWTSRATLNKGRPASLRLHVGGRGGGGAAVNRAVPADVTRAGIRRIAG